MAESDWGEMVKSGFGERLTTDVLDWIDSVAGGLPYFVQAAASALWDCDLAIESAEDLYFKQVEGRFEMLWRDLNDVERSSLRSVVDGNSIDTRKGVGDRLVRYGVLRQDGRLFSSMFGEWIRENGGGI